MNISSITMRMDSKSARVLLPIAVLVFLFMGILSMSAITTAQDPNSDVTFKSPEEAITFYMQALAEGDVVKMMQAFAVNEMSENFRLDLFINRVQAIFPSMAAPSSDYPFYVEMNRAQFSWEILFQTRNLTYGLLASDKELFNTTVKMDAEGATAFIQEIDPARLDQLEVVKMGIPEPELAQSERLLANWDIQAQIYGADEFTERVVLLQFEENYYAVGFAFLRYGEDWKIRGLNSALSGLNSLGAPQQMDEDEFQELIGEQ